MSLVHQTAGWGDAIEGTDSLGGCITYANTTDAMDSDFQAQAFTLGFAFQLEPAAGTVNTCRWGMDSATPAVGNGKRFWIEVTSNATQFHIKCILDTTACGFQIVEDYVIARDTAAHKVAWAYDAVTGWRLVVDNAQVSSGASVCANISQPFSSSDRMTFWTSTVPGDDVAFWGGQAFYTNVAMQNSQMISIQQGGLP